jgi:hypothetical protein
LVRDRDVGWIGRGDGDVWLRMWDSGVVVERAVEVFISRACGRDRRRPGVV